MDIGAVVRSVASTGRLVVVHEAHQFAGLGAEVVAAVAEHGIPLKTPPRRIATPDARIPAAPALLAGLIPDTTTIARHVREMMTSSIEMLPLQESHA
jgi:pyruvate/2-oxoglutarate/acetoin dehydrogenase E1 component